MDSIDPEDIRAAALKRLPEILADPQTKALALHHAGQPDIAGDALQNTYFALARLKHLGEIANLPAYVRKVLVREIYRERNQLGATLIDDFVPVAEAHQDTSTDRPAPPPAVGDAVCASMQAEVWLERFAAQRDDLRAAVPSRSADPDRYRGVICDAAAQVLRDGINGEQSDADSNTALQVAYPEHFSQPDAAQNTMHQRFRRAREDIKALLRAVVNRDELT